MAPALRQSVAAGGSGVNSVTATFGSATLAGSLIIASMRTLNTTTINATTDSAGNTYTSVAGADIVNAGATNRIQTHYSANSTAGVTTVTANFSATGNVGITIAEVTGVATSSPVDQATGSSATTGTAVTSGNITTTQADYVWGYATSSLSAGPTMTANAPYTLEGNVQSSGTFRTQGGEDQVQGGAGTTGATFTFGTSGGWTCSVVGFLPAAGTTQQLTASGSSTSSGTATLAQIEALAASGSSTSSGTAALAQIMSLNASGSSTSTGTADLALIHPAAPSTPPPVIAAQRRKRKWWA